MLFFVAEMAKALQDESDAWNFFNTAQTAARRVRFSAAGAR